jgi:HlyD family secretion protein
MGSYHPLYRPCSPGKIQKGSIGFEKIGLKAAIFLLVVFSLLSTTSCKKKPEAPKEKKPVLVEVTPVEQAPIADVIQFTGSIEADAEIKVFPKISAAINQMKADIGDPVKKGEVIAVLESEELVSQLAQTEAALEVVRAQWAQMETGARPEEIAQAEDLVTKAEANLKEAESNYRRMKDIFHKGTIAEREFESAELAYTVATADLSSARERLRMLKAGATKEDRDALKAQIRQAEAAEDLAKIRLAYARITSPLEGIVSERFYDPGDLATPGMPLFTIVQMDHVKVMVSFTGNQFEYMKPGTPARVRVAAYSDRVFEGTIDKVSPTLNPQTRLFSAEIGIENEKHLLRPGMFANVTFSIDPHPDALLVPKEAVLYRDNEVQGPGTGEGKNGQRCYLFVIEGDTVKLCEVSTGYESDGKMEIREGVKKDEKVVTRGLHRLKEGDKVEIVNPGGDS